MSIYGKNAGSIGKFNLNYNTDNLALISVDGDDFPGIVTSYSIVKGERIQEIPCFNDVVHIYVFGKTPIKGNISGFVVVSDDEGKTINALESKYASDYRAFESANAPFSVSVKGQTLTGIATNFGISVSAEVPVMINFSLDVTFFGAGDTVLTGTAAAISNAVSSNNSTPSIGSGGVGGALAGGG